MQNPEPLFSHDDDDFELFGDPPTREEEDHEAEVDYLDFSFRKIAQPKVFVEFELRNAVSAFRARKSKLPLTIEDAEMLKAAVGIGLRAALCHPQTRGMKFLTTGMAAICEAIDRWAAPDGYDPAGASFLRSTYIRLLTHEAAIADIVSTVTAFSPAAWEARHSHHLDDDRDCGLFADVII